MKILQWIVALPAKLSGRFPSRGALKEKWLWFAENAFWFFVLVSWLPMVADIQNLLANLRFSSLPVVQTIRPDYVSFVVITVFILLFGLSRYRLLAIICAFPALIAVLMGEPGQLQSRPDLQSWLPQLGLATVLVSAVAFIAFGRIRSLAVGVFLLLAAIEAFSGIFPLAPTDEPLPAAPAPGAAPVVASSVVLTFGRLFYAYHLSVLDIIIVSSLLVLGRFVVLVIRHNRDGWRALNKNAIRPSLVKTAWLSIPFFVMIGILTLFWQSVTSQLEARSIEILAPQPAAPKTLEEAVRIANEREQKALAIKSAAAVAAAKTSVTTTTTQLVSTVMPNARASFPSHLMALKGCKWYDVLCHVMNGIKSVVNSLYRKARDAALNALEAELRSLDSNTQLTAEQKRVAATAAIERLSTQTTGWANTAIVKTFETARWIGMILSIYSFIIIVKTLMVIMSRNLYQDGGTNFASLRQGASTTRATALKVLGNEATIYPTSGDVFVTLRYEIRNAVANISCPQPLTGLFGRLLSGRYLLGQLLSSRIPSAGASIVVNAPTQLVSWELDEDEEIIVRFSDLVAFSGSVRLATEINLSLQATLFGRFFFQKVIGPGVVILQTEGEAVAGRKRDTLESRRSASLTAWTLESGFQIQSNLDWRGVYLAPYNIRKNPSAFVVYDVGPKNVRWSSVGMIKSIRTFLLPF